MMLSTVILLAAASCGGGAGAAPSAKSADYWPPRDVRRCIEDAFGNYTCTDGTRVLRDKGGAITIIPGRQGDHR